VIGGCLIALVGLVPALKLSWDAPDREFHEANQIYAQRLSHHLLPQALKAEHVAAHLGAFGGWLALCIVFWRSRRRFRRLGGVVLGAAVIAAMGCGLAYLLQGHPLLCVAVMRFYWFRLSDAMVPLGVALWASTCVPALRFRPPLQRLWLAVLLLVPALHLGFVTYARLGAPPRADSPDRVVYTDWVDVCHATKERTPRGARCLTPRLAQTFHWHAERPEVANHKDIPQDAASIVEWATRIRAIQRTFGNGRPGASYLDIDDVRRLAHKYEASFLIVETAPALDLPRVYANRSYALYDLR
jgi:hypothetical protein